MREGIELSWDNFLNAERFLFFDNGYFKNSNLSNPKLASIEGKIEALISKTSLEDEIAKNISKIANRRGLGNELLRQLRN